MGFLLEGNKFVGLIPVAKIAVLGEKRIFCVVDFFGGFLNTCGFSVDF